MQADLIVEGKIATCDAHNRIVEAFAVKDGKIIACGTLEECVLFKGEKTKTVIQDTGLIIPGMTEGHAHASKTGNLIFGINLYGEHSVGIYQQKIRKYIKDHPDRDVILGKGFLNGVFSDIGPTADLLNEITNDRAIIIEDFNGHTCWVNSFALEKAKITQDTPDPVNGMIVRYPGSSVPTGWLKETAMDLVETIKHPYTLEDYKRALLYYQEMQLKNGVTVSFEPVCAKGEDSMLRFRAYHELEQEGKLKMTLRAAYTIYPEDDTESILNCIDEICKNANGTQFQLIAIKLFADGVVEGHTAYLRDDYADQPGYNGYGMFADDKLNNIVDMAMERGYIIHTHAIGDKAIDQTLDAYQAAEKKWGLVNARNAITHLQVLHKDQIARMANLHIVAVPNPYWHWQDPVMYYACEIPYLGEKRAEQEYPMKSILDAGIITAQASDFPVTVPARAIDSLHFMVNRKKGGQIKTEALSPDECISVEDGLRVLTWNGAYENRLEKQKGSIKTGKDADFVLLNQDVLTCPKEELYKTKVLQTYVDGEIVSHIQ